MASGVNTLLREAVEAWEQAGEVLKVVNRRAEIDEMAILFAKPEHLDDFVEKAASVAPMFNEVPCDVMRRRDRARQEFNVRFKFLQPNGAPFRLECMAVLSGDAPLHARRLWHMGRTCIVHASYKLPNEDQYMLEYEGLKQNGQFCAEYENSYGVFSYWKMFRVPGIYLKPRVNLRDL